jgi:hypothetical protein
MERKAEVQIKGRDTHVTFFVKGTPTDPYLGWSGRTFVFNEYDTAVAEQRRFLADMTDEEAHLKAQGM